MKNNNKFLFLDTELGGRSINYSLLTAYLLITDADFNKIDDLELNLKPDNGEYVLSGQGMAVNKIDIVKHDLIAKPYTSCKPLLYNFLKNNTDSGKVKLTVVGHGIVGDIKQLQHNLISKQSWDQFCYYNNMDTGSLCNFLRINGIIGVEDTSIEGLCKHFCINQKNGDDAAYHTAKFDTLMIVKIFKKLCFIVKNVR